MNQDPNDARAIFKRFEREDSKLRIGKRRAERALAARRRAERQTYSKSPYR